MSERLGRMIGAFVLGVAVGAVCVGLVVARRPTGSPFVGGPDEATDRVRTAQSAETAGPADEAQPPVADAAAADVRVLGVGGVFFRARDPVQLGDWYARWLGLPVEHPYGASLARGGMPAGAFTVWAPFREDTDYFDPGGKQFMFNLIVDDLDRALARAAEGGAEIAGDIQEYEYGRFGWFVDPEGTKVELWELPEAAGSEGRTPNP